MSIAKILDFAVGDFYFSTNSGMIISLRYFYEYCIGKETLLVDVIIYEPELFRLLIWASNGFDRDREAGEASRMVMR